VATVTVTILKHTPFFQVVGDENLEDWGFMSRTLSIVGMDGVPLFNQLPSVMRFDKLPQPNGNDWRVNEEPLRDEYIQLNNYDGDGIRRCQNYLWKDNVALYNNKGFPYRQYLVMSRNLLKGIKWEENDKGRFLKFETLKPTDDVSQMTVNSHPHFVHRFDLVGHNSEKKTYHTWNTPRGLVYYFLTSVEGYGYIPERYVREA